MFIGFSPSIFKTKIIFLYYKHISIYVLYIIYTNKYIFCSFSLFFLRICYNPLIWRIPFIFSSETCFFIFFFFLIWVLLLLCMFWIFLSAISVSRSLYLCLSSLFSSLHFFSFLQILSMMFLASFGFISLQNLSLICSLNY